MIPRRISRAVRFEMAARRLGRHKASRVSVDVWSDYGNAWGVAMEWGAGATSIRHGVRLRPYASRRRGGMPSPERMAMGAVKALAGWRRRKRIMKGMRR
jgi:hypothetical protein